MTSITQEIKIKKKKDLIFSYYWLLLNSYHFIQILYTLSENKSNPIDMEKAFSGSEIKFS